MPPQPSPNLEKLKAIVIELGAATAAELELCTADIGKPGTATLWAAMKARGIINQAQTDTLEMASKGYMTVEAARVTIAMHLEKMRAAQARTSREVPIAPALIKSLATAIPIFSPPQPATPSAAPSDTSSSVGIGGVSTQQDLVPLNEPPPRRAPSNTRDSLSNSANQIPPRTSLQSLIGKRLGKYHIQNQLGRGASGSVFLAHHSMLNMSVAIKLLDPALAAFHPELLQRFMHEARSAARINHPNIIRLLDCDEISGYNIIVMEYVDGISLAELININGTISEDRALFMAQFVAEGLEAALESGIIHRDIKPANILVTKTKQIKLADLGLAKRIDGSGEDFSDTRPNVGLGTPHYFAPEQANDASTADHRADIYALGATLFHMLTGNIPFKAKSLGDLVRKHQEEPVRPPAEIVNNLTRATSDLVCRMMAKAPADRYQTYGDLINAIQTCILSFEANKSTFDSTLSSSSQVPTNISKSTFRGLFGAFFEKK